MDPFEPFRASVGYLDRVEGGGNACRTCFGTSAGSSSMSNRCAMVIAPVHQN